jgi:septal ring factor EnvC (AmiA/AmiB activator)
MGFLDKLKQQATDVASTVVEKTQETAKTGQLQIQLRNLKSEEKEALSDLGAGLMALGDVPASLSDQAARVREVREKIAAKEAEVADLKEGDDEPAASAGDTVESDAVEVSEPDTPASEPETPPAAKPEGGPTG